MTASLSPPEMLLNAFRNAERHACKDDRGHDWQSNAEDNGRQDRN